MSYLKVTITFAVALQVAEGKAWNNLGLVAQGFVVVFFPLWELAFLETNANKKTLGSEKMMKKFGTLYSGYKLNSFETLTYPIVSLFRKILFVFTATHANWYSTF
jgi:hypothetical protein